MQNNQRTLLFFTIIITAFAAVRFYKNQHVHTTSHQYTIGILQTASHPALDAARQGFTDLIESQYPHQVNCMIHNGQGSVATLHTLAQKLHVDSSIDMIYAIATPATQAITSMENQKPIGIAAVSLSPDHAMFKNHDNIFGMRDAIDVAQEIDTMCQLLPSLKTVGILFSSGEINSQETAEKIFVELTKRNISPVKISFTSEAEIETALTSALKKVDALIAPTDNLVASAITLIALHANKAQKPLIVSDNMLVSYGALMARGIDYYQSGRRVAEMAIDILIKKEPVTNYSLVQADTRYVFVNKKVCKDLNITIPEAIKDDIIFVE